MLPSRTACAYKQQCRCMLALSYITTKPCHAWEDTKYKLRPVDADIVKRYSCSWCDRIAKINSNFPLLTLTLLNKSCDCCVIKIGPVLCILCVQVFCVDFSFKTQYNIDSYSIMCCIFTWYLGTLAHVELYCLDVVFKSTNCGAWFVLYILSRAASMAKLLSYSHFIQNIQKCFEKPGKRVSSRTSERCWKQCHLAAHSSLEECYRKPRAVETAGGAAQWLSPSVSTLGPSSL